MCRWIRTPAQRPRRRGRGPSERMQRRAVRRVSAVRVPGVARRRRSRRGQPSQVVATRSRRPGPRRARRRVGPVGPRAGEGDRPALREWASFASAAARGRPRRPSHSSPAGPRAASLPWRSAIVAGPVAGGRAPTAVAAAGTEPHDMRARAPRSARPTRGASAWAVHRPVKPAPTIATSTSMSPSSAAPTDVDGQGRRPERRHGAPSSHPPAAAPSRQYAGAGGRRPGNGTASPRPGNHPPSAPAGWYADPEGGPMVRCFDGRLWTPQAVPVASRRLPAPSCSRSGGHRGHPRAPRVADRQPFPPRARRPASGRSSSTSRSARWRLRPLGRVVRVRHRRWGTGDRWADSGCASDGRTSDGGRSSGGGRHRSGHGDRLLGLLVRSQATPRGSASSTTSGLRDRHPRDRRGCRAVVEEIVFRGLILAACGAGALGFAALAPGCAVRARPRRPGAGAATSASC